jgi:hypothetical protein
MHVGSENTPENLMPRQRVRRSCGGGSAQELCIRRRLLLFGYERVNPRLIVGSDVGRVAVKTLTDRAVRTAGAGRYGDGTVKGLMLVVRDSGARSWVLRYQVGGRRRDMGLGPYPEIGLAEGSRASP